MVPIIILTILGIMDIVNNSNIFYFIQMLLCSILLLNSTSVIYINISLP